MPRQAPLCSNRSSQYSNKQSRLQGVNMPRSHNNLENKGTVRLNGAGLTNKKASGFSLADSHGSVDLDKKMNNIVKPKTDPQAAIIKRKSQGINLPIGQAVIIDKKNNQIVQQSLPGSNYAAPQSD